MKSYEARVYIDAEPKVIWDVLTDGSTWPDWDSGADRVEGKIAPGETIKLHVKINPGRAFPVKVTEFVPEQRLVFTGGMPLGLFKGVRVYTITPQAGGAVLFTMREDFTGPLEPLIGRTIPDLGPSFTQFVNGLKQRAESLG